MAISKRNAEILVMPVTILKREKNYLNKCPYSDRRICMPEIVRSAILFLFKNTVKIRHIVEAAFVGNLINALRSFNQHARCVAKSHIVQCINKCFSGS